MIEIIEIKRCDLCGEEVDSFVSINAVHEANPIAVQLRFIVWYSSDREPDICIKCSDKLLKLLNENFPNKLPYEKLKKVNG